MSAIASASEHERSLPDLDSGVPTLRPNRGRWGPMLARSAAAFRASRKRAEVGRRTARAHRAGAGLAAGVGLAGVATLVCLAASRPELGLAARLALIGGTLAALLPALACAALAAAEEEPAGPDLPMAEPPRPVLTALGAAQRAEAPPPGREGRVQVAASTWMRARRHARIKLRDPRTSVLTEDRRRLHARVIDVSQSGVALEGNLPGLWVGSMVSVGARRAKAVRALAHGMAFEFSTPIPIEQLEPGLIL